MLVGIGGRQHDDASRADSGEQPTVEIVVGGERAAALQCQDAVHHGERRLAQASSTDSNVVSVASLTPIDRT